MRFRHALAAAAFAAFALFRPLPSEAAPKAHPRVKQKSVGAPNHGKLEGASHLHASKHLSLRTGAHPYGTLELTHLLRHVSDEVGKRFPSASMLVGDLSAKDGGPLTGHGSHQSGRDADVGFFVVNSKGKPVNVKHFVAFDPKGDGRELPWAHFDDARNWALVEALVKDEKVSVKYIFVINGLRARLLAYGAKHKATKETLARAAMVMMSPDDADLHDNHFHVRIACPESSHGACVENAIPRGAPATAAEPAPSTEPAPEPTPAAAKPAPAAPDASG